MANNYTDSSRRKDRFAEMFIRVGGVLVIFSVVGILLMIAKVALPLFYPSSAEISGSCRLLEDTSVNKTITIGIEENQRAVFTLNESGVFNFQKLDDGSLLAAIKVPAVPKGASKLVSAEPLGKSVYTLLWDNGAVSAVTVAFTSVKSADGKYEFSHDVTANDELSFAAVTEDIAQTFVRVIEGKGVVRVDFTKAGSLKATHRMVEQDLLGNEKRSISKAMVEEALPGALSSVAVDSKGHYMYAGTTNGWLLRWDISEPGQIKAVDSIPASDSGNKITSLALVTGDVSIAVGEAGGQLSTWFPVKVAGSGDDRRLTRIHVLRPNDGPVSQILPSPRDKTIFSNSKLNIHADHMTSESALLAVKSDVAIFKMATSPKGNSLAALNGAGLLTAWKLNISHPEVSFGTLFGKVWYEGYDKPEYAWQSSAANDDFEPKISLVPLVFGTIKATLFAMLFAVPLALLAALYTSQFMSPTLKGKVKPVVEIMAAIPSVVIGFLAGLWLAPLLDKSILTIFLSVLIVPLMLLVAILLWKRINVASDFQRVTRGKEFFAMIPVVVIGVYVASLLAGYGEVALFGGDFKQWLFSTIGVKYDQRNSIVIATALGFAVVPIIFTIAEDAISNVPRNLTAASLALGASRWQTAWRVVLPSALPGVFSAIMVGFGRAIGETMIVLMATGNTPIMSWSLFNGLRSLSANIAVEIPEAPLNSSLYRTLFLSAVLLFIFTFIINTVAESMRQKFRKKYGRY